MRPPILDSWFASLETLKGVGPAGLLRLKTLLAPNAESLPRRKHLLFHRPVDVLDWRAEPDLATLQEPTFATLALQVHEYGFPPPHKRQLPTRIACSTATGDLTIIIFNARPDVITRNYPIGQWSAVSGKVERRGGMVEMLHPHASVPLAQKNSIAKLEPVYPLTAGLTNKMLQKWIAQIFQQIKPLAEWQDVSLLMQRNWPGFTAALQRLHQPEVIDDLTIIGSGLQRLAYDELLAAQLALALTRERMRPARSGLVITQHSLREKLFASLPFQPTANQLSVLKEIDTDLASGQRMLRLLQGDVGSGKTLVALAAALSVLEAGAQTAIMAPTETLARQHAASLQRFLSPLNLRIGLLCASMDAASKRQTLEGLADGSLKLVVGTHALFQEAVQFHHLGLAVVDEQHRFGVGQRLALTEKGRDTHILMMTATPIPRSLTLTQFGDMDSSLLREKPVGRQPIATKIIPLARREEVLQGLQRALDAGEKIYWICPQVEATEGAPPEEDTAAATLRHLEFAQRFRQPVALAHGRLSTQEREAAMASFASGQSRLLVATTVVEVGVDVPDATIIVIEQAERFGLSQLHQLRGRVGRGDAPSSCLLLYGDRLGQQGKERLTALRDSNDGFFLAEEDLRLRGAGELLGTRQSGLPTYHFAELPRDAELLRMAHAESRLLVSRDAELKSERGEALRSLLYLFEQDARLRFLRSG